MNEEVEAQGVSDFLKVTEQKYDWELEPGFPVSDLIFVLPSFLLSHTHY